MGGEGRWLGEWLRGWWAERWSEWGLLMEGRMEEMGEKMSV